MSIERKRLLSLVEYAKQSAIMRTEPVAHVAEHNLFSLYEHQILGLPGIRMNIDAPENENDIWLSVERLHETRAPEITSKVLQPWVTLSHSPLEEPRILESVNGSSLIAAGTHCSLATSNEQSLPVIDPESPVPLSDYDRAAQVRAQFSNYLDSKWRPWAKQEKPRRETIRLYSRLFTLNQDFEGGIVEKQIELIWGVGLGIWNSNGTKVQYPLVTCLVELSLNSETAEIDIRPRDVDVKLELDWYRHKGNAGVPKVEKAAKHFYEKATTTFSPFDPSTFQAVLRSAVAFLADEGIYWPEKVPSDDRTLPKPDEKLKVTDTWVLFARPRTNNLFLQDLDKLKKEVEQKGVYPPALAALVTDPGTTNPDVDLPRFRGVSASYHCDSNGSIHKARDLFFPKPFNDEQVKIIQLLDVFDGVVVQGPPGTGKTHTIANIICHYLAEGKRVLVTSMKDPALVVLQEQLPAEIRPLAISLLTTEQEGMKQFEHAINKIASEVQALDRTATRQAINCLEETIEALHGRLNVIDRDIGEWGKRSLAKIKLGTNETDPQDAAREVVGQLEQLEWFPDRLGIEPEFAPQFSGTDIVRLREARRKLGEDINYLDDPVPQIAEFPDPKELLHVHQDLRQFEKLKQGVEQGEVPALADSSQKTLDLARELQTDIETLKTLRERIDQADQSRAAAMRQKLLHGGNNEYVLRLEELAGDLGKADEWHSAFLKQPVTAPQDMELHSTLVQAVENLAKGNKPFGLFGSVFRSEERAKLDAVLVLGDRPSDPDAWKHVSEYLSFRKDLRRLADRWNALAQDLSLEAIAGDKPEEVLRGYGLYKKVNAVVVAERALCEKARTVFPDWSQARNVANDPYRLSLLEKALKHHITKERLDKVWAVKEQYHKVLVGGTGRIIKDLGKFLSESLGNPAVTDADLRARWSELMEELRRVHGLGTLLATVREVCEIVEMSGAPLYASMLKKPIQGTVDVIPDNLREAWRLKRLATYLESIDVQEELKKLAKDRADVESSLSRAYHDIVVKRTWLKLAENASQKMRAALEAYLAAIQKIGKGAGKRAVRYRRDARRAASVATPAVPCWIMAHYRVSESLPAELGSFDLVIIDEASQSDLTALPSFFRANKALIVGDDKQVSPGGIGLKEEDIVNLMNNFLGEQVPIYRPEMSPERSIYDLFKVVFASSTVMLKEHFRCVPPIIEYSKRQFYNHELCPLRVPKASERLDPPLIDVMVPHGNRKGDLNLPEARFIVDEIKAIVDEPNMTSRSIGVVSLLGDKQARRIWDMLTAEVGPEVIQRHRITCGGARTFQGKERDIMFLTMVSAPNDVGIALSGDTFAQRFNVAASRAKDRMYLVRSVDLEHLSSKDAYRRTLISHFANPFMQDPQTVEDLRSLCESPFEREMYDELTHRGYRVTPQVKSGAFAIDMVVEGENDARLAIECDGDQFHGPDRWAADVHRQRILERAGWVFWRCFASTFIRRREEVIEDLLGTLTDLGIHPVGAEDAPRSVHTERRVASIPVESVEEQDGSVAEELENGDQEWTSGKNQLKTVPAGNHTPEETSSSVLIADGDLLAPEPVPVSPVSSQDPNLAFCDYHEYSGPPGNDPRNAELNVISEGIVRIVDEEGPAVARRVYEIYLRSCGIRRMGRDLQRTLNESLRQALKEGRIVYEKETHEDQELFYVLRPKGSPPVRLRSKGPRSLADIPPSELYVVANYLKERHGYESGSDDHLKAVLECFGFERLTTKVGTTLLEILERKFPHADEFLDGLLK